MSDRWPGGIIRKTPVIPTGPNYNGAAPGMWTLDQAAYWKKQGLWPTQGVGVGDPYFPYVTMLLATTSLNGGQNSTFLDSSTNNFTFTNVNTPTQGSFSPYGSNWSGYFDGSGDWITTPNVSAFDLSSSSVDFTIEAWVYNGNGGAYNGIIGARQNGTGTGWCLYIHPNNTLYMGSVIVGNSYADRQMNTTTIPPNTWAHVALVKTSSGYTAYVNGVGGTLLALTGGLQYQSGQPVIVGALGSQGEYPFNGYISNIRIVKGTAVYTANFTPPTAPLTAIANTSYLTCAYNRFRDGSANNFTITVSGDSKTTDFSPFSPSASYSAATNGGSLVFNGSNEAAYVDSSNAALTLGTGDFTIELWVYQRVLGGTQSWVSTYGGPGSGYRFSPTNTMQFSWGDSDVLTSSATPDINQWCHVAVTRPGSTVRIFKNGVVVATGTNSTDLTGGSTQTTLGRIPTYNQWYYNGYMSDVRIVKGTAVYTADFTPPTTPLTAISGTSLLARGTNANIFDAAATNDMLTLGNAQVSTAVSKFGGSSLALDGNGDYLLANTPATDVYSFGTGDFTIETWVYVNSISTYGGLIDTRSGATTSNYAMGLWDNSGNKLDFIYGSTRLTSASTFSTGQWVHFAVTRASGTIRLFINGVVDANTATYTSAINAVRSQPLIGAVQDPYYLNGYMDDFRITKGYARYTANFTPPTQAFPTF